MRTRRRSAVAEDRPKISATDRDALGWRRTCSVAIALLLLPGTGYSQSAETQQTVQDILRFLVTNQGVQTSDFDKDRAAAEATHDTLTRALLASVATLPVSSSSGGFTYRLNPALGTMERASETFGTFFVERALTAGTGQASFGFALQYASFNALDGNRLRDGELVTTANRFTDEPAPFDFETLTLAISTRTATFFGNVGLNDRIDVGVAVPVINLSVSGSRVNVYRGRSLLQARAAARTVGVADIAIRTKVRVAGEGPTALAGGAEVRLPTGREEDLLGAGDLALRLMAIGSAESGPTSVHGNLVMGFGGLGRELSFGGALAAAVSPRLTLVGELLGRRVDGIRRIDTVTGLHPRISGVTTTRLVPGGIVQTSMLAVAGMKMNVGSAWLVHANVLVPLTGHGLTATFTPTVSLDYTFAR